MRRFVQIARGSANEVEYHLLLAKDLEVKVLEIQRMLASLVQSLWAAVLASGQ
jgi:four helix bundle protein